MGNDFGSVVYKTYEDLMKKYEEAAKKATEKIVTLALHDLFDMYTSVGEDALQSAAEKFYSDYSPSIYDRKYSLSKPGLLDVTHTDNEYRFDYDPGEITPYRNGYCGEDGLFEQVFVQGWHGGADKIAPEKEKRLGRHPNPGIPYYRTPKDKYYRWKKYGEGRAEKSSKSPLRRINETLDRYEEERMQADYQECLNRRAANIEIEL